MTEAEKLELAKWVIEHGDWFTGDERESARAIIVRNLK